MSDAQRCRRPWVYVLLGFALFPVVAGVALFVLWVWVGYEDDSNKVARRALRHQAVLRKIEAVEQHDIGPEKRELDERLEAMQRRLPLEIGLGAYMESLKTRMAEQGVEVALRDIHVRDYHFYRQLSLVVDLFWTPETAAAALAAFDAQTRLVLLETHRVLSQDPIPYANGATLTFSIFAFTVESGSPPKNVDCTPVEFETQLPPLTWMLQKESEREQVLCGEVLAKEAAALRVLAFEHKRDLLEDLESVTEVMEREKRSIVEALGPQLVAGPHP